MNAIKMLLFLLLLQLNAIAQSPDIFAIPARGCGSWQPAATWEESLLTGNGTMGALVMGSPHEETIIMSHALLYLPQKKSAKPFQQAASLDTIRALSLQGKFTEAAKLSIAQRKAQNFYDERDPFIPAFDIKITQTPANIFRYNRTVNFATGETSVNWQDSNGSFQRKLFISRADSVAVLRITGTGKINCTINFDRRPVAWNQWAFVNAGIASSHSFAEGQWLGYRCGFKIINPGSVQGYEGLGRLILKGGTSTEQDGKLVITGADEVLLITTIQPAYHYAYTQLPEMKNRLNKINSDYVELLNRHIAIHGKIFNRSKLNLNGTPADRALYNEALLLKAVDKPSLALIERTYDAGRYNILCAMGTNPPNLQGIWAGSWQAPWVGGMTQDGNLPTAISGVIATNMPELMDAYFNYQEKLLTDYRIQAKVLYNCRGIHIPAQTTTSGWETDFGDTWCLSFWTGAAGWAANYFYDYFMYTGNKDFLANRAYPFMKEAALFYEDFLTLGKDGRYVFNPSYSPENNPANSSSQASINATMDVMIATQLLKHCIASAEILQTDRDKILLWKKMLSRMPVYEVSAEGTIREWLWPGLKENFNHRHTSNLYALYDELPDAFKNNSALKKAALETIEKKLQFRRSEGGGEMAFGLVQLGLSAAHLGDAAKANETVNWLSTKYWSSGMGSFHNVKALFNTDISGGLPYTISQMLVYSEPGLISVLPALPTEWPTGKIEGLLLRGQVTLNKLSWAAHEVELELVAPITQKVKLQLPTKPVSMQVNKINKKISNNKNMEIVLPANQPVMVRIAL